MFFFGRIVLVALAAMFFFSACTPKNVSLSSPLISKKEIKGRFLPPDAIRLSDILNDSIQNFLIEPDPAYREKIIELFQGEFSPLDNYQELKRQLPEAEGRGELNYLFYRFSHAPSFQGFKKKGNTFKKFVREWVEDALSTENPKLRALYSQYYPEIKPSSLHYFSFVPESEQIFPGEYFSVRSLGLPGKKTSVTLNFLIEKKVEDNSQNQSETFRLVEADRRELGGRSFEYKKKISSPGLYRLSIYNAYFFKEIKFYVSSINISAKNDGELMVVWGSSSAPDLNPPYEMVFESHSGKKWKTNTDEYGLAYVVKDVIGLDSLLDYKISLYKDHHLTSMSGVWREMKSHEKLLYPHLFLDKTLISLGDEINFTLALQHKNIQNGFIPAEMDSLKIQLINSSEEIVLERIVAPNSQGIFEGKLQIPRNLNPGYYTLQSEWAKWKNGKVFERYNGGELLSKLQLIPMLTAKIDLALETEKQAAASYSSLNIKLSSENASIPFGEELVVVHFSSDVFPTPHQIQEYLQTEITTGREVLYCDTLIIPPGGKLEWKRKRSSTKNFEWVIAKSASAGLNIRPAFKLVKGLNAPIVNMTHASKISLAGQNHTFLFHTNDERLFDEKTLKVILQKNGKNLDAKKIRFTKLGTDTVSFIPEEPGIYNLKLTGNASLKPFEMDYSFFVPRYYGEGLSEQDMYLVFDKEKYSLGDSVFLKIYTGLLRGSVLLSRESNQIQDMLAVSIQNHSGSIGIPLEKSRYENPHWRVSWQKEGRFYFGDFQFPLQENFNQISSRIKLGNSPSSGTELTAKLDVRNIESKNGAFFYALIPREDLEISHWLKILSPGFQDKELEPVRKNYVRSQFSRDILPEHRQININGMGSQENSGDNPAALAHLAPQTNLENTYRYKSDWIGFKSNSMYPFSISLPEKSGDWLLQVWGYNAKGPISAAKPISISGDISIKASGPQRLSVGDKALMVARIENLRNQSLEGVLNQELNIHSGETIKLGDSIIHLDPGEVGEATKLIHPESQGKWQYNALLKLGSKDYSDSRIINLKSNELEESHGYIHSSDKHSRNFYRVRFKSKPGTNSKINFLLFPGISSWLEFYLLEKTHHESDLLLSANNVLATINFLKNNSGRRDMTVLKQQLNNDMDSFLISISNSQRMDGGWSWGQTGQTSPIYSAYMLKALSGYKNQNQGELPPHLNQIFLSGIEYLQKRIGDYREGQSEHAFICYVLALSGNTGEIGTRVRQISGRSIPLSPPALAFYYAAAEISSQNKPSEKFLALLERQAIEIKSEVSWNGDLSSFWFKNHIETTGWILDVLSDFNPKHPLTLKIIPYLCRKWDGEGWHSPKTTSVMAGALAKVYSRLPGPSNMVVKNFYQGKKTNEVRFDKSGRAPVTFSLASNELEDKGEIILGFDGQGELLYSVKFEDFGAEYTHNQKKDLWDLEKTYSKISYQPRGSGLWVLNKSPGESFGLGDEVEVTIRLKSEIDLKYLLLKDLIPAGFHLIQRDSNWVQKLNLTQDVHHFHLSKEGDYSLLKIQSLAAGEHWFRYYLKATYPGEYHARESQICEWFEADCHSFEYPGKLMVQDN